VTYHFIKVAVERRETKILYIPTSDMIDVLTKPFHKAKHMLCTERLGVKAPEMLKYMQVLKVTVFFSPHTQHPRIS
jgi:hypothetical protein